MEEGAGSLYKGLAPNILRGMSMNVGMLACYDQAKETVASLLGDPMTDGKPQLTTQIGASCVAVSSICCIGVFYHMALHPFGNYD